MRIKLSIPISLRTVKRILDCPIGGGDEKVIIEYVSTDTRSLEPRDLFFALLGERYDGEDFIDEAKLRGAVTVSSKCHTADIVVKDTRFALLLLAEKYKSLLPVRHRIAITGSVGKTTTKELTAKILSSKFKVHATEDNFNNEIGVALTILSAPADTEVLVIEAGMNHKGELSALSKCISPTIAVITNVGTAHIGNLGSTEAIAEAKAEIGDYLSRDGIIIAPPGITALNKYKRVKTASFDDEYADVFLNLDSQGYIHVKGESYDISKLRLPLFGSHVKRCLCFAAGVAEELGISEDEFALCVEALKGLYSDSKIIRAKGLILIDDSYNASLESVKCSIEGAVALGPLSLCLGDILELGEHTERIHRQIGAVCRALGVKRLYLFGKNGKYTKEGALAEGFDKECIFENENLDNPQKTAVQILDSSAPGDAVLFKASHKIELGRIVKIIESL